MQHKMHFLLTIWLFMSLLAAGSLQTTDLTTIKAGMHFGEALTTAMNSSANTFVKFLGSAGLKAVPFISAAVSFVEFILSFLGNNESQELLAIKRLYNEMDRRFDIIELQFEDIKKIIDWAQVRMQYSEIEKHILTDNEFLRHIYTGPLAIKNSGKDYFIHAFENNCFTCAEDLYLGIIGTGLTLSSEIFDAAVKTFRYDRPKTQTFMIGILKLLIQGITNELAYRRMKYGNADFLYHKNVWSSRLQNVTAKMLSVDELIRSHYMEQADKDITILSITNPTSVLSHQKMATKIYNFLVKKYDWLDWLVIVYDPISTIKHHINHVCDGLRRYGMYGRDVVISSVKKSKPFINIQHARGIISETGKIDTVVKASYHQNYVYYAQQYEKVWTYRYLSAQDVYNQMPPVTRNCSVYGSVGVIDTGPWYEALPQRLVHSYNNDGRFSIHLFG